jgi:hypothetical protein
VCAHPPYRIPISCRHKNLFLDSAINNQHSITLGVRICAHDWMIFAMPEGRQGNSGWRTDLMTPGKCVVKHSWGCTHCLHICKHRPARVLLLLLYDHPSKFIYVRAGGGRTDTIQRAHHKLRYFDVFLCPMYIDGGAVL